MIEARTLREKRAVAILAEKDTINKVDDDLFTVKSQTGGGRYRIEWTGKGWNCNCPDYITRGGQCKHILATRYYLEIRQETTDGIKTERIPLTYKQAWSAYNAAQTQEIELFDQLLKELVSTVSEPEQTMGRTLFNLFWLHLFTSEVGDRGDGVTSTLCALRALCGVICEVWGNKSTATKNQRPAKNHSDWKIINSPYISAEYGNILLKSLLYT